MDLDLERILAKLMSMMSDLSGDITDLQLRVIRLENVPPTPPQPTEAP